MKSRLSEHVPDQVVLVQPLHDDDDRATARVVEPAIGQSTRRSKRIEAIFAKYPIASA